MTIEYVVFVLLGFFASIISAVFGFGTALVVLALGSHVLPIKETIALATVLFAVTTISKTVLFTKHIDWRVVATMPIASLPFAYLGAMLLTHVPAQLLKRLLGIMVLIYIVMTYYKLFPKVRIGTLGLIFSSASYGFLSGLLGSGNLIKAILFKEIKLTKEAFVGAMAATSVLSNLAKLTAYTKSGLLTTNLLWPVLGLVISGTMAVFLGRYILRDITVTQFERSVQVVLAVSTIGLLF